ncbi:MAG: GspE/PulE family protein, partial [Microthrixaceae bacterium]
LPTHVIDDRVFLASADPLDTDAIQSLTKRCNRIGLMIGPRNDIDRLIDQAYNALTSADDMIRAFELSTSSKTHSLAGDTFHVDDGAPLIQVVNRILTQGARIGASDIHIQPAENSVRVRFRVDGAMTEAIRLPESMGPAVSSRLKVLAELNIVEKRRPQDGQFSIQVDGRAIDVRLSVVPTINGEKAVMRLLDKSKSLISMPALGMIKAVEEPYLKMARSPLGMILCTGPTGAGKTTTLYATLNEVNDPTKNVVTIEDPVEYQFDGVAQMQVSETGMSFADGLRGILRQDPDVILVGEIRDAETARIAMQAALTGHLVLSSLHSIDSIAAVHRFIDMGIEPFLVASALNGIIAQRLLRRLCLQCRVPTTPTANELAILAEHTDGQIPETWYRSNGCSLCNDTGYQGRVGVYELLEFSEEIRDLVGRRATHAEIKEVALAQGLRTMADQAFMLVTEGTTSVDEVLRSVYSQSSTAASEPRALGRAPSSLPQRTGTSSAAPENSKSPADQSNAATHSNPASPADQNVRATQTVSHR